MEAILRSTSSGSVAMALELVTASITNPTELNSIGTAVPDWRLVRTNVAGSDQATLYRLDADTDAVSAPYIMASATAGLRWVAIAGAYHNGTTASVSPLTGTLVIGTGTTATNVGIGGGVVYAGTNITVKAATGFGHLLVDSTTAAAQVAMTWADNGTAEWSVYKETNNSLRIFDRVNGSTVCIFTQGSAATAVNNVALTKSASSSVSAAFIVGDAVTAATNVGIGGGNINAGANITAITFGTNGSFTPTLIGTGGGSAHSYVVQSGLYIKVGKRVDFSINIAISAKDGTMTGPVSIAGLPFPNSAGGQLTFASVLVAYMTGLSLTANYYQISGYITTSASQIQLLEHGSNLQQGVPPANIAAATQFLFSGFYYTDS